MLITQNIRYITLEQMMCQSEKCFKTNDAGFLTKVKHTERSAFVIFDHI